MSISLKGDYIIYFIYYTFIFKFLIYINTLAPFKKHICFN